MTLYQQQMHSDYLSLVNGAAYYVSVRAISAGAQALTATASSPAVKVPPSAVLMPPLGSTPLLAVHAKGCNWVTMCVGKDVVLRTEGGIAFNPLPCKILILIPYLWRRRERRWTRRPRS